MLSFGNVALTPCVVARSTDLLSTQAASCLWLKLTYPHRKRVVQNVQLQHDQPSYSIRSICRAQYQYHV